MVSFQSEKVLLHMRKVVTYMRKVAAGASSLDIRMPYGLACHNGNIFLPS